ncbi:Cyclopropane-fatty-acyl-phospholipid synthase (plasmid) [Methylovirgula sp. HY1]|nr:Cyclopropane-fatty-acyl-phospholipid synthase [Methylovirgula sp. HY1]
MFEHVGVGFYDAYFGKCANLLAEDGVFLLHSIGRSDRPGITNPWMAKYIFPGGYIPALSEVLPAIERSAGHIVDQRAHATRSIFPAFRFSSIKSS